MNDIFVKKEHLYMNKQWPILKKESKGQLVVFGFFSEVGIMLMRFIAFAYLYHYLNWFSKTKIIRYTKCQKTIHWSNCSLANIMRFIRLATL